MGLCPNKSDLVSKAAFIALFFSSRFFLSHMAICIPIKFSIYMGEVGELNKRPIPNSRPSCMDDQKLIRDLYQIRSTRMHFFLKINKRPGSSIWYRRVNTIGLKIRNRLLIVLELISRIRGIEIQACFLYTFHATFII